MSAIVSSVTTFLIYSICCLLLYRIIRTSVQLSLRLFIPCVIAILLIIMLFSPLPLFLLDISAIIVLILSVNDRRRLVFHDFLLIFIINESVMGLWESVLLSWNIVLDKYAISISDLCVMTTYGFGLIIKKHLYTFFPKNSHVKKTPEMRTITFLYYAVIILAFLMLSIVAILKIILPEIHIEIDYFLTKTSLIFSYIAIGGVAVVYVYISSLYLHFVEVYRQEQMTNTMVRDYYKLLLEKENDTKAFRHDMHNHLISLRNMIENEQKDKATEYLETMQQSVLDIQERVYVTGNTLIDAITNYFLRLLPKQACISIRGVLPEELSLNNYYLNTVYSNLLQNAVEASFVVFEDGLAPVISIEAYTTSNYLHIIIENTCSLKRKRIYLHDQQNTLLHGFGKANVRKALQQLNGLMEINTTSNTYKAIVQIPLLHSK